MFIATLFTIAEIWKQPKCPLMEEWITMDKEDVVCIYIYIYITQPLKKNKIMPFAATWVDLQIVILSEISQIEEDKYHVILL